MLAFVHALAVIKKWDTCLSRDMRDMLLGIHVHKVARTTIGCWQFLVVFWRKDSPGAEWLEHKSGGKCRRYQGRAERCHRATLEKCGVDTNKVSGMACAGHRVDPVAHALLKERGSRALNGGWWGSIEPPKTGGLGLGKGLN